MYNIDNIISNGWESGAGPSDVVIGVLESVNELLERKGIPPIYAYEDPATKHVDQHGFIFSTDELTTNEVKVASQDIWGDDSEPGSDEDDD